MNYKVVVHESEEGFRVSCPGLPASNRYALSLLIFDGLQKTLLFVFPIVLVGVLVGSLWFAHSLTAEVQIPTPLCMGPPTYETPNVPCSGVDVSALKKLPITNYCDLVRDQRKRANEIVRVRGIYSFNQENSALDDPSCRNESSWTWVEVGPYSNFDVKTSGLKRGQPAEVIFAGRFSGPNKDGYGHLNCCQYELVLINVDEVIPLATAR